MRKIIEFEAPKTVMVKVHDGCIDWNSPELCTLECEDVIAIEEVSDKDAECYEEDFLDDEMYSDRHGEYLILHFKKGTDVVYRKNEVNISYS